MRGRKPHPLARKVIAGNPSKQKLPALARMQQADQVEILSVTVGEPPSFLTPAQAQMWRDIVAASPRGVLCNLDANVLAGWVVACSHYQDAKARVEAHGMVTTNDDGVEVVSPYVTIMDRKYAAMLKAAAELGFTPVSRARLALTRVDDGGTQNPWLQHGRRPGT